MSKITVSDFIIAFLDLVEAESRALQESAEIFMQRQRKTLRKTLYKSGWMVGWIVAAVISLLGAIGFLGWGVYTLFARYISETAAPFAAGVLFLIISLAFGLLAARMGKSDEDE